MVWKYEEKHIYEKDLYRWYGQRLNQCGSETFIVYCSTPLMVKIIEYSCAPNTHATKSKSIVSIPQNLKKSYEFNMAAI